MKIELYDMLMSQAISEKDKALLTLNLLSEHPAGIGDHSTEDFYKNANEALGMLVDADDKISILQKYFPNIKFTTGSSTKFDFNLGAILLVLFITALPAASDTDPLNLTKTNALNFFTY